jgi:REP element-mobilizing transposase RayT
MILHNPNTSNQQGFPRRRSIRLRGYDYSQPGLYFITICVHERACLFGKIANCKMVLNDTGKIAVDYWSNIPEHFPHTVLHEFIVMPNHVHGIIEIAGTIRGMSDGMNDERTCRGVNDERPRHGEALPGTTGNPVGPSHWMADSISHGISNATQFGKPVPGSISVIINQYKSSVKRWCNKNGHSRFQWQSRFHEHIIRNEQSYQRISEYIINNPAKWTDDKFYST